MTINYPEVVRNAQAKVAQYTLAQCHYALMDCHATLVNWPEATDYTRKLWAEIDACRDRVRLITQR